MKMTKISLRVPKKLLSELTLNAEFLGLSKMEYVRQAIINFDPAYLTQQPAHKIQRASMLVRKESMKVNTEFEQIESLRDSYCMRNARERSLH